MSKTYTKGNVIVEEIKVGDIHYEYDYGLGVKCQVKSLPIMDSAGLWIWKSVNLKTAKTIKYTVDPRYSHYSANLYDYEAYQVKEYV